MRNGYFQLVSVEEGFGVRLIPPKDGGQEIDMAELMTYIGKLGISYDLPALKKAVDLGEETVFFLASTPCPLKAEEYALKVSPDYMKVIARFFPPSENGKRMPVQEFLRDMAYQKIVFGLQMENIQAHFSLEEDYCTDVVVAQGVLPRQGKDAQIYYHFNTDITAKPLVREDDTVDYYDLNIINHCTEGEELATLIPADEGESGQNVFGKILLPQPVLKLTLKKGQNVSISQDGLHLIAQTDGQVRLVEDRVVVSNVFEAKNIDLSTGNITFEGSVVISGNVFNNMRVVARDNIEIRGMVEGAYIEAGGNIIIAGGMNGMSKGMLKAGGNIVVKFLENAQAQAGGYVQAESIIYSNVAAGTEIIVAGKKGFITGGHVQAGNRITTKILGSEMGATTIAEVGVNPQLKIAYLQLQKEVAELFRQIKNIQPVIANFTEKKAKGVHFSQEQIEYVKENVVALESKKKELEQKNEMMKQIRATFDLASSAEIIVQGVVCQGTNIVIGDVSMNVAQSIKYCKFQNVQGNVQAIPLM